MRALQGDFIRLSCIRNLVTSLYPQSKNINSYFKFLPHKGIIMFVELNEFDELTQKNLYFKLDTIFNLELNTNTNEKIKGVYAIFKDDICLYVGQSKNLASRIATHLKGKYAECTNVYIWDIKKVGWSQFDTLSSESQTDILDNTEKWLMTELKPIENINVDFSYKSPDNMIPDIYVDWYADFSIMIEGESIYISNPKSILEEDTDTSIEHSYVFKKITKEERNKFYDISRNFIYSKIGINSKNLVSSLSGGEK